MIRTSKEKMVKLSDAYISGMPIAEIKKKFNCGWKIIQKSIKENAVSIDRQLNTIYKNESIFKIIDSKEKAYFLGLIYADGCIINFKNRFQFYIGLNSIDSYILDILSTLIGEGCKVGHRVNGKYNNSYISLGRKNLCTNLIFHGVNPKKSFDLKWPKTVPPDFMSHFVRGFFDGDGGLFASVRKKTNKKNIRKQYKICIIGAIDFMTSFSYFLTEKLGIEPKLYLKQCENNSMINMWITKQDSLRTFLNWVYRDSENLRLERKYDKYLNFIEYYDSINIQ